ncbi:ankyrin repeat domain-containing protein, partial [bacterium]
MPFSRWFLLAANFLLAVPIEAKAAPTAPKIEANNGAQINNALIDAIGVGNIAQMEELFKRGANPNARNQRGYMDPTPDDGAPAIFEAIKAKSLPALRLLVNRGANVNATVEANEFRDSDDLLFLYEDLTPLDYATKLDQTDMVKLLLGAGAKTNFSSQVDTGQAFQVAAAYNALGSMRLLLNEEDKKERPKSASGVIWWAATKQNEEMVQLLVEMGADKRSCGQALTEGLRHQNLDIAFILLNHADLNASDSYQETLL